MAALIDGGASAADGQGDGTERKRRGERAAPGALDDSGQGDVDEHGADADQGRSDGDDDDEGDEGEQEGEQHADDATPTLDDLAEHAALTAAELNKLPVKLGGGVTLTLGEMKARWSELVKLDECAQNSRTGSSSRS